VTGAGETRVTPRTVLLTGGTGFIGANLARRLLRDGHSVHLLVRPGHAPWRLRGVRRHLALHTADLADGERVAAAVRRIRPEWVLHLAAYGAYPEQNEIARIFRDNVAGTANLVDACLRTGCEALVNTGSSSEYGFADHAPREDEPPAPNSYYAVSKVAATMLCLRAARAHRAPIVTLRPYSVYGPFEQPTRLIPTVIMRGLEGALPPLVDPRTARDFVFVDDVVDAYLRAAGQAGRRAGAVYNVGTGVQTRIAELVELARDVLRIADRPRWGSMPGRGWDTRTWVADPGLIREQLGWRPLTSLREGFGATVDWLRSNPPLLRLYREAIDPGSRARPRATNRARA